MFSLPSVDYVLRLDLPSEISRSFLERSPLSLRRYKTRPGLRLQSLLGGRTPGMMARLWRCRMYTNSKSGTNSANDSNSVDAELGKEKLSFRKAYPNYMGGMEKPFIEYLHSVYR